MREGQGVSCFAWPWESVAILPTTLTKLAFVADQITLEKVGVQVSGLAVYRIAEPRVAFAMIDGGDPGAIGEVLREMFVGATRRIVSGLSLDECLTHRKARVAAALMQEIAPVLAGEGHGTQATGRGWGVVLDTIEIQDVRVLSPEVFSRLQAPYRATLKLAALHAESEVAETQARLAHARALDEERARVATMEHEEARLARERARDDEQRRHEQARQADSELAAQARELRRVEASRDRLALELAVAAERLRAELDEARLRAELDAERTRLARAACGDLSEARLREVLLTETMPRLAEAYRATFGTVQLTQVQTDGGEPLASLHAMVSSTLQQLMATARG